MNITERGKTHAPDGTEPRRDLTLDPGDLAEERWVVNVVMVVRAESSVDAQSQAILVLRTGAERHGGVAAYTVDPGISPNSRRMEATR